MQEDKSKTFEQWILCGKYQLENINGKEYIRPVNEEGFIRKDFFRLQREKSNRSPDDDYLVTALLNIDTANKQDILDFVNTYGLLGLLQHKYLEHQSVLVNGDEYFFVPERDGDKLHDVTEIVENYLLDFDDFIMEGFFKTRRTMSEPLEEFIDAVHRFQGLARYLHAIERAETGRDKYLRELLRQDDHLKEYAEKELATILPMSKTYASLSLLEGNITINKRLLFPGDQKRWRSQWSFVSLLSAAYFFLTEDLENNFWIGVCPRCHKYYLSSVGSKIYCSRKCEDANRKAKERKKKGKGSVK